MVFSTMYGLLVEFGLCNVVCKLFALKMIWVFLNVCSCFMLYLWKRFVTHDFGYHDDVLMMVYSGSSLELSLEKKLPSSLSRNHSFEEGSQAANTFACENA
jgi:hypothetical protein